MTQNVCLKQACCALLQLERDNLRSDRDQMVATFLDMERKVTTSQHFGHSADKHILEKQITELEKQKAELEKQKAELEIEKDALKLTVDSSRKVTDRLRQQVVDLQNNLKVTRWFQVLLPVD